MKQKMKRVFGFLLSLALVLGLMPGMSLTALAEETSVTLKAGTTSSGVISSSAFGTIRDIDALIVMNDLVTISASSDKKITKLIIHKGPVYQNNFNNTCLNVSPGDMSFNGDTCTVTNINSSNVQLNKLTSGHVAFSSIEVYYDAPTAHSVTVTPGSNMTKTTDSGAASQSGLSSAMTPVVYTVNDGYYFPTNYSVAAVNGISVTRNSYTQITVSGTPTADATITLTAPAAKQAATVTKASEAKPLTYTGSAQELVTAGEAENGTMQYALGTDATTAPTDGWGASIPSKTDAGTYYVWYKAKGNAGYTDSDPKCLAAKIAKESGGSTAVVTQKPEAKSDLVESDSAQMLVTTGKAENGTMQYALGKDENTAPSDGWSADVLKETAAGTYYVWYKAKGNDGYSDSDPVCVTVKIAKKGEEPGGDPSDKPSGDTPSDSGSSSSDSGSSSSSSSSAPAPWSAATAQVSGRGGAKTTETLKQEYVNVPVQANSAAAALGITDMGAAIDSLSNPVAKTNLVTAAVNLGNVDIGTSQSTPATASVGLAADKVTTLLAVLTPEELVGVVTGNANVKVNVVLSDAQPAAISPQVQNAIQAATGPVSGLYYMNMDLFVATNNGARRR